MKPFLFLFLVFAGFSFAAPSDVPTDLGTISGTTALTVNRSYKATVSANRAFTFSGNTSEGVMINLALNVTTSVTLTIPSSYQEGGSATAVTSLSFAAGQHSVLWKRKGSVWTFTSDAGVARIDAGQTFAGTNTFSDLVTTSSLLLPNGSAPTTDAFGEIAADNNAWGASRGAMQFYDGTANTYAVAILASDSPSDGQSPVWHSDGTTTWETIAGLSTSLGGNGAADSGKSLIFDAAGGITSETLAALAGVSLGESGATSGALKFYDSASQYDTNITPLTLSASRSLRLPDRDGGIAVTSATGSIPYGASATINADLLIGAARNVLQVNAAGTLPEWTDNLSLTSVSANTGTLGALEFEGSTADANETTLTVVDPTADRTITFPNSSGTVALVDGGLGTATATTPSAGDNDTSVATTAFVQTERLVVTKSTATSYTIGTTDSRELYGGVIYVTGAATITIPAVAAGASFTVITIGAVAVSVDPNAADLIYLNGTALSDGDKVTNASTTGDMAVFTYYDGTGWYCATNSGWVDGN